MTIEELHLDNIQPGMEIVTITPKNHRIEYGTIKVVGEYSELHGKWRLCFPNDSRHIGFLPSDGKGYFAMHSHEVPHFYYSANPKHIKAAKKVLERKRKKIEEKEKKTKEKLAEFKQKLDCLLKEYGADIHPIQLSGDDQGVDLGLQISIDKQSIEVDFL